MAETVGSIEVVASINTKDYDKGKKQIEKDVPEMQKKANSLSKGFVGFGKSVASGMKMAGVAAIGFGTIVSGLVLKGGIERALNIEDAQAKLKGLGHDTKSVKTIMDNALASVKGTAYGLDAAATTAANAVASGIKPGKQLEQVLKTVANTASLSGRGMDEMGAIFNKVAASNKVQMDVINQLHDAGVPALAALSKELGVTSEEAAKMASAGKINFETFERAMRGSVGNAAVVMGDTVRGSLANMRAAMSRVGAALVTDIMPKIKGALQGLTDWIDNNQDRIVGFFTSAVDTVKKAVKDFNAILARFNIKGSTVAIGVLAGVIAGALVGAIYVLGGAILASPLLPFVVVFGLIGAAVALLMKNFDKFKPAIDQVGEKFGSFMNWAKQAWQIISNMFLPSLKALWNALKTQLMPALNTLWTAFKRIYDALQPGLTTVLKVIGAIIGLAVIGAIWLLINALNVVVKVFSFVVNIISDLIGWLANLISWFGNAAGVIINALGRVGSFLSGLWDGIKNGAASAFNWIRDRLSRFVDSVKGFFSGIWSGLASGLKSMINTVLRLPLKLPEIKVGGKVIVGGQTLIPALAKGGLVTAPTLAMVGEGRESEAVLPLSKLDSMLREVKNEPSQVQQPQVTVNLKNTKGAARQIAVQIFSDYNEVMRSKGLPEVGVTA